MARISYWLGPLLISLLIAYSTGLKAEPIHDAVMDGDIEHVSELLTGGSDVNTTDVTDITVENFFAVPSTAGEVTTASARCASFPQQEARSLTRQTRR